MFLPISDDNPSSSRPFVTWILIGACSAAFLWQLSLTPPDDALAVYALGMIPAVLFGSAPLPPEIMLVSPWTSVLTSMFLHGGWFHLGGNMLYLWIFGDNIEDSMGHGRFLMFYVICGVAAVLAQALIDPQSQVPLIGASGAIAGVLGAYLILHPRANVRVLIWLFVFVTVISVPAFIVLGIWIVGQFLAVSGDPITSEGGIAYFAHIGGFIAGMALVSLFRKRNVPLLQAPRSVAFEISGLDPHRLRKPPPR